MKVALTGGVVQIFSWLYWAYENRSTRRYSRKIVFYVVGGMMAALLEVNDFPPLWGLVDAHCIWHGLTPWLVFVLYSFLADDSKDWVSRKGKTSLTKKGKNK